MEKPAEASTLPRAVTLQDIADSAGVSRGLVSRVLRGNTFHASVETAERIRAAAQALGYDPAANQGARRLVMQRTGHTAPNHLIALFFPNEYMHHPYFLTIFRSIIETLSFSRYAVIVNFIPPEITDPLPHTIARGDVDGAMVIGTLGAMKAISAQLRAESHFGPRPIVSLIEPLPGCACVVTDDRSGGYLATRHLLDLGHRHFIAVGFEYAIYPHRQYQLGCHDALHEYGLDPADHLRESIWFYAVAEEVNQGLHITLRAHPEITALLTPNDPIAIRVAETLAHAGQRVPEHLSLVGYDDTDPLPDAHGNNRLTTVRLPLDEVGRTATDFLLRRITGEAHEDTTIMLPVELVVRGTTAPPLHTA